MELKTKYGRCDIDTTENFFRSRLRAALLPSAERDWLYEPVANLSLVYQLDIAGKIVPVTRKITENLACSELSDAAALRRLAFSNMKKAVNLQINSVASLLAKAGLGTSETGEANLYTLCSDVFDTPALVLDPETDQAVRSIPDLSDGYCIIPCSVHEPLFVSDKLVSASDLTELVQSINKNNIAPRDFLSDSIYKYHDGNLVIVR